jgi:hypothetical protein
VVTNFINAIIERATQRANVVMGQAP